MNKILLPLIIAMLPTTTMASEQSISIDVETKEARHYNSVILVKEGCVFYGVQRKETTTSIQAKCGEKIESLKVNNDDYALDSVAIVSSSSISEPIQVLNSPSSGLDWSKM